jgi:predicted metal-binding membrane protein
VGGRLSTRSNRRRTTRPRAAIGRPAALATVAALVGLAVIAWLLTVRQAMDMRSMVTGVADVGTVMPNDMSAPVFMTMWVTMMVAMMFPTIAPMVLAHRMVVTKRAGGSLASIAFVAGYLVLWTVAGIIPLALFLAFNNLAPTSPLASSLPRIAGATLLVAGLYQFTPFKAVCLRGGRNPFDFITSHDFGAGPVNDFRAGLSHGAFCLGCCWARRTDEDPVRPGGRCALRDLRPDHHHLHGPNFVDINFEFDKEARKAKVSIDGYMDTESEPLRVPATGDEQHVIVMMPSGFEYKEMEVAIAKHVRGTGEVKYDHSGTHSSLAIVEHTD